MPRPPFGLVGRGSPALAAILALGACEQTADQPSEPPTVAETPAPPAAPVAKSPAPATIRGELTFPSDYLPEDLQVCAREVASGDVFCQSQREGDKGYSLEVPAGTYEVWAHTRDWPPVRAFYSEFIRCGRTVECTDHTPIAIEVAAGEDLAGIDPGDWYAQQQ